ncbi:hypothetical protein WJX77_000518 [Trebouxia sp. C0004]
MTYVEHLMFHRVVPASVLAVVAAGFAQSIWMILYKPWSKTRNGAWAAKAAEISGSAIGSSQMLLIYRLLAFLWCNAVAVIQFADKGFFVLKYYTVWNYYLMIIFFALATLHSFLDIQRQQAATSKTSKAANKPVTGLGYFVVTLFHINLTTVFIVDVLTWGLLWPMLKANPDPTRVEFFTNQLFNFTSYNQHGFNFVLMVGETFLNRIPFYPYLLGYVGMWTSFYGIWAFINFSSSGKWMYPFLDASQPWAPFAYLGLFAVHWVFFGFVILLLQIKYWILQYFQTSRQQLEVQMAKVK